MRRTLLIFATTVALAGSVLAGPVLAGPALAAEPVGEWLVANGDANIRVDDCNGALWGMISWEKGPPGTDSENPDPALRNRPMLGLHILRAMKLTKPDLWEGEVYNAENGKTYNAKIHLVSPDVLRIDGCVLGGLICGGENWSRVKTGAQAAPAAQRRGQQPQRAGAPPTACSGLPRR